MNTESSSNVSRETILNNIKENFTMKNTNDFTTTIMEKKETLDILESLMEKLGNLEDDTRKDWDVIGTKQRERLNDATGEYAPVYLDENDVETFENTGKPKMVNDYGYVEKKEFTDRDKARLTAIDKIRDLLVTLA